MKLLTHNMLTSRCLKGVSVGYPLKINASEVQKTSVDFNQEFIQRMIPKIDWKVASEAAKDFEVELPTELPSNTADIEPETLKRIHHALLEIEIIQGDLICPETGRKFPIKQGIPNMLINEDEV